MDRMILYDRVYGHYGTLLTLVVVTRGLSRGVVELGASWGS